MTTVSTEAVPVLEFALGQNYPNPVIEQTEIPIRLSAPGPIQVVLYDVLGKRIRILRDGFGVEGVLLISVDVTGLSAGTYVYSLSTEQGSAYRTMVVAR